MHSQKLNGASVKEGKKENAEFASLAELDANAVFPPRRPFFFFYSIHFLPVSLQ